MNAIDACPDGRGSSATRREPLRLWAERFPNGGFPVALVGLSTRRGRLGGRAPNWSVPRRVLA